jgi:hypothetical protein
MRDGEARNKLRMSLKIKLIKSITYLYSSSQVRRGLYSKSLKFQALMARRGYPLVPWRAT